MSFTDPPWTSFTSSIDTLRSDQRRVDVNILQANKAEKQQLGRLKSSMLIWLYASLESFVTDILMSMVEEVESRNPQLLRLKPCFHALCYSHIFECISDTPKSGNDLWQVRQELSEEVLENTTASFNSTVPLDGSILRGHHFRHLWNCFGFQGHHLPPQTGSHETALKELADDRNDLAHGNRDPTRLGRQITARELKKRIIRIEEVAGHLHLTVDQYVQNGEYLRA
jgi:hypothetical protein